MLPSIVEGERSKGKCFADGLSKFHDNPNNRQVIFEQRANIKFCFKLDETYAETFQLLKQVYGEVCLSSTRVCEWLKQFVSVFYV